MKPDLPVWRSLLYVPVNVEKYVDKAAYAKLVAAGIVCEGGGTPGGEQQ